MVGWLIGAAGLVTLIFAGWLLTAGLLRMFPQRRVDGAELFGYGIAYSGFALFWMTAAAGISLLREWGWWTALLTSLAAVVHGAYHISESPPLGLSQAYGGWPAAGVWFTTIVGGLALAGTIAVLRTFAVLAARTVESPQARRP